jgi:hypothetical protein
VNLDRDRLGSALIRPPAARLRRYVETERADRALRRNNRRGDRATLDVVATMWSIADSPAPRVADLFYEDLAARGGDHAARC